MDWDIELADFTLAAVDAVQSKTTKGARYKGRMLIMLADYIDEEKAKVKEVPLAQQQFRVNPKN